MWSKRISSDAQPVFETISARLYNVSPDIANWLRYLATQFVSRVDYIIVIIISVPCLNVISASMKCSLCGRRTRGTPTVNRPPVSCIADEHMVALQRSLGVST